MRSAEPIPTVLRIDVEPDEHQPHVGDRPWDGLLAMCAMIEDLRPRLADLTGHAVRATWLIRLDPDIERAFGRAGFAFHRHADEFDGIRRHEDVVGIHVHALRWDPDQHVVFSDYAEDAWTARCLRTASQAFAGHFGRPPAVLSFGGYLMREALLDIAVEEGITRDLTVEPGLARKEKDPSLGAYATAPTGDFVNCPQRPYYPSQRAYDTPATARADARPILMVPMTAYDYQTALTPWYRQWSRGERHRPKGHLPLNPWKHWPSPRDFWDLAARAADEQPARYLAFALRTEARDTDMHRRVSALFEYLPRHPIARRLRIVDPLSPGIAGLAEFTGNH